MNSSHGLGQQLESTRNESVTSHTSLNQGSTRALEPKWTDSSTRGGTATVGCSRNLCLCVGTWEDVCSCLRLRYKGWRRVRGDGNCAGPLASIAKRGHVGPCSRGFYRSVAYSLIEQIAPSLHLLECWLCWLCWLSFCLLCAKILSAKRRPAAAALAQRSTGLGHKGHCTARPHGGNQARSRSSDFCTSRTDSGLASTLKRVWHGFKMLSQESAEQEAHDRLVADSAVEHLEGPTEQNEQRWAI